MIIKRIDGWLAAQVGDELVMMSADTGAYLGLNAVGARIWALIDAPRDVDSICATLLQEFEVTPEACRAEVETFIGELKARGAVETA